MGHSGSGAIQLDDEHLLPVLHYVCCAQLMRCVCRKAKGAVLVYDISDPKSLAAIDRWKSELQDQGDPDLLMMLVGNKSDLEGKRKVSRLSLRQ